MFEIHDEIHLVAQKTYIDTQKPKHIIGRSTYISKIGSWRVKIYVTIYEAMLYIILTPSGCELRCA